MATYVSNGRNTYPVGRSTVMQLENTAHLNREFHDHCSQFVEQVRLLAPVDRVAVVLFDQELSSSRVAFDWRTAEPRILNPDAVSTPAC